MSCSKMKKRFDMSQEEKQHMASQMKRSSTDEHLKKLLSEWNCDPDNRENRQIDLKALRNIRNGLPRFADAGEFWDSVQENVTTETEKDGASAQWKPFQGSISDSVPHLDAAKSQSLLTPSSRESALNSARKNFVVQMRRVKAMPLKRFSDMSSGTIMKPMDLYMPISRAS